MSRAASELAGGNALGRCTMQDWREFERLGLEIS